MTNKETRVNISLVGEEAEMLVQMQQTLNNKLMMKLSIAQIVKRIIRKAAATELV